MKTVSGGMATLLNSDTTTLCTCWNVTRTDGNVYAFTDHDQDLVISGVTYLSSDSYTRTSVKSDETLGIDNLEVIGMLDSEQISDIDMANGLYDYAQIQVFMVNWMNLSDGIVRIREGWLGEVVVTETGTFKAELRGLTQALTPQFGDLFSQICRADLGDAQCKIDLAAITYSATVSGVLAQNTFEIASVLQFQPYQSTNTASIIINEAMVASNDGLGVEFTLNGTPYSFFIPTSSATPAAVNSLVAQINDAGIGVSASPFFGLTGTGGVSLSISNIAVEATLQKLDDTQNYLTIQGFSDGYMDGGIITWTSGNNNGVSMEIKSYNQGLGTIVLFLSMKGIIQVGDTFNYGPGCDKTRETCYFKFNNILNFRGEPDMPGMDAMLTYPNFGGSKVSGGSK